MRAALLLLLLAPTLATAAPRLPRDIAGVAPHRVKPAAATGFAQISHLLYLDNCLPNGCSISPGFDDALHFRSSIPQGLAHIPAWTYGDPAWQSLVSCVETTYAPFDVQITTTDPGPNVPHFTVIVGGKSTDLDPTLDAGGVAPYIPCDGDIPDSVMSFVFSETTSNENYLCGAIAQESSHVWGLDHELNADDPMTYLALGSSKRFQLADANCGEDVPRTCYCGTSSTQNSFQYLADTFGPATLEPATLAIASPANGAWVSPGFVVRAQPTSQISVVHSEMSIDGGAPLTIESLPVIFNAPANLAAGDHVVTVTSTDKIGRMFSQQVTVHVLVSCDAGCPSDTACLGGKCLPNASVAGGLGATCATNDDCSTGQCGSDSTKSACTAACDAGDTCPSGFDCLTGVCWAQTEAGGGCSSMPAPAFGLTALLLTLRRRRAVRSPA